mgnify:CR=1 FL=1
MKGTEMFDDGKTEGRAVNMMGPDLPVPVYVAAGGFGWGFQMPLMASQEQQPLGASLNIVDLTVADMLWGLFDPTGVLPRDPATLAFKLDGLATLFHDLTDPNIDEMEEAPGEVNAMSLTSMLIKVAGASIAGEGSFTFDNSDLETFDGMPRPLGAINLNGKGLNGLIDKLVQMGLLPDDQAMGARMMMGLFAVPGPGEDELNSTIEVNEQGQNAIHTMVEKPATEDAPSRLGVVGRYILDASVFGYLHGIHAGAGGEIQLTDGIAAMLKTHPVLALPFDGERYDCGSRQGFIRATIDYALEDDGLREDMLEHMRVVLKNSGKI